MWKVLFSLAVYCILDVSADPNDDLTAGPIFNPAFYINNNPEVVTQGIEDPGRAKEHWLSTGLKAGLQACGNFHTKQYLQRYPDLAQRFGQNYTAAALHYLKVGRQQGMLGFVDGGFEGRYTISNPTGNLVITASERMGGAVDSIVFDNTEFINAYDHGRELQIAMTFLPNGECFNPTEAGGRDDGNGKTTKTVVKSISAANGVLSSTVMPAFWLRSGDIETQNSPNSDVNCNNGSSAINNQDTYTFPFAKKISIGCPGVGSDPCFTYRTTVTVGGNLPEYTQVQIEGPTGYHTGEFNTTASVDITNGNLIPFSESKPLVFSTWCLQHAFGVWAPPGQDTDVPQTFGVNHFLVGRSFADATQKWNAVWKKNRIPFSDLPKELDYTVYICVGTQVDAAKCVAKLVQNYKNTSA